MNQDIEKSCLTLGFYLASWGMLRASFLLQHSVKQFYTTIQYINSLPKSIWSIDVDKYSEGNIQTIIQIYQDIKKILIQEDNADLILITKVLLGVFGFIPAFDRNFCKSFRLISEGRCGFRRVNKKSLTFISDFYNANQDVIDKLSSETITTDFLTEKKTQIHYTKAKIIDMYGFSLAETNY
ncbi:MAG: hypothetical protein ABSD71_07475 [Bacteroidales bacterium]